MCCSVFLSCRYFARDASYAHRYAKHVSTTFYDDSDYIQVKQMILSDVFTGCLQFTEYELLFLIHILH
eukprot:m.194183 g.194183  ORF g.194183 m.194183 type:complete len:68 (+) comp15674_c0_seq4:2352-2555(+)